MKITFENFRNVYPQVEKWLDAETKRDFKDSEGLDEFYNQDEEIKGMFDTIIAEMNAAVEKNEKKGETKKTKTSTKEAKKKEEKYSSKSVDYIITNIFQSTFNKPMNLKEAKEFIDEGNYVINEVHVSKEVRFPGKSDLKTVESLIDETCKGGGIELEHDKMLKIKSKYGDKYQYSPFTSVMTNCIAVYEKGELAYIVDAQGFNYARYIYFPSKDSKIETDKNLKWLDDNLERLSLEKIKADIDKERSKHGGWAKGDLVLYDGKVYPIKDFMGDLAILDISGNGILVKSIPIKNLVRAEEGNKVVKKPSSSKSSTTKPSATPSNVKLVDAISDDVKVFVRFIKLQGKTIKEASYSTNSPRVQLKALQTAIRQKKLRKTSPYAKEIMDVQASLIKMVNGSLNGTLKGSDVINITNYDRYKEIAESEKVSETAAFAKSFISIQETTGKLREAKSLLARIEKSKENNEEIEGMKSSLKTYIDGKSEKLKASEKTLRGLYGICSGSNSMEGGVMNSIEMENKHFEVLDFKGKWGGFFGRPDLHFKFMFYGRPGNGKSTLALQLAGYLSKEEGKKVLYVAKEEGFGYTMQEKIKRLGVSNANLFLAEEIPANLDAYDVIFLDSVNTLELTPEDLKKLPQNKAYVYVFQSRKDGEYMGAQGYGHDADAVVKIEKMVATKDKNRFGGEILEYRIL